MPASETALKDSVSEGVTVRGGTADEDLQKFGPLKATLKAILDDRADRGVRFQPASPGLHLC